MTFGILTLCTMKFSRRIIYWIFHSIKNVIWYN